MEEQEISELVNISSEKLNINLTMMESLCIVGHIALALKHPESNGPAAILGKMVAQHLIGKMVERWPDSREMRNLIEMWRKRFDIT